MKKIQNLLLNNDLILLGETHGTKEIPNLLLKILLNLHKKTNFIVCLEIPKEFENNFKKYFLEEKEDGRGSLEYFKFVSKLKEMGVTVFFIDEFAKYQQEKENNLAKNIMNVLKREIKTIVILGDFHAYQKPIQIQDQKIFPAAHILNKKIKKIASIRINAKKGKIFNSGIKEVIFSKDDPINLGFDLIYTLKSVSPCNFLKN